jgi:hypothetical protein
MKVSSENQIGFRGPEAAQAPLGKDRANSNVPRGTKNLQRETIEQAAMRLGNERLSQKSVDKTFNFIFGAISTIAATSITVALCELISLRSST